MSLYQYSIVQDFPNQKADLSRLDYEIRQSSIVTAIDMISSEGDAVLVKFKASLSPTDKQTLDNNATPAGGLIGAHSGEPLPPVPDVVALNNPTTSDHRLRVAIEKSDGSRLTIVTHDWTDPTTWYQGSVRVEDEALSRVQGLSIPPNDPQERDCYVVEAVALDAWLGQEGKIALYKSGAWSFLDGPQGWSWTEGKLYKAANKNIIDLRHGKIWNEDKTKDAEGNFYFVATQVEGVDTTEKDPHDDQGDYVINFANGLFFFDSAISLQDEVTSTYYYAMHSHFVIKPHAGKKIGLESVDVQFSSDVDLTDSAVFEMYGLVDVFAPELLQGNGGPLPSGTLIPIDTTYYKTMRDFQAECDRAYPPYPPIGGASWRGIQSSTYVFHWDYVRGVFILSSLGMELHIYLHHNKPYNGEYATATLYAVSESE